MKEITLGIIKPDAVEKKLIGKIVSKIESCSLTITDIKMVYLSTNTLDELYKEHIGKTFLAELIEFMSSGPVVLLLLEGEDAVKTLRSICGDTNPEKALPGTIRGDCGEGLPKNAIHASDSPNSAKREIQLFFPENQLN